MKKPYPKHLVRRHPVKLVFTDNEWNEVNLWSRYFQLRPPELVRRIVCDRLRESPLPPEYGRKKGR